jgi:mannitol/fructose-specific phosphotransferase system IIA component (Ntr-type)
MALAELLSPEQIIPEMKAIERWDAIVELMDLLVARNQIKPEDKDGILAALKQREETMSTGIGFGIAIPHCSSDRLDKVVAAFGRSSKGIEFQTHLRTLASIAKFLNDRAVRDQLASADSADAILQVFRTRGQS